MLDNNNFKNRQEFILNSNELIKPVDLDVYTKGNKQKVELDKKLEEESIKNNVLLSGNIVRQNILNSSASKMTTVNNIVDNEVYLDEEDKSMYDRYQFNLNKGKDIMDNLNNGKINNNSTNNNNSFNNLNNFDRNNNNRFNNLNSFGRNKDI